MDRLIIIFYWFLVSRWSFIKSCKQYPRAADSESLSMMIRENYFHCGDVLAIKSDMVRIMKRHGSLNDSNP